MARISLKVNGAAQAADVDPHEKLLYVLRNHLKLNGPKFGCGLAECGACTVMLDGKAIPSCIMPVSAAEGHDITTLEGLGSSEKLHPLQQAFIDEQAAQCAYCINGMIMTAKALLDDNPHPSENEIKQALAGNLCGCGTHLRIVRAVKRAASNMA